MTVGTPCIESLLSLQSRRVAYPMGWMALQAQVRLAQDEQLVVDRSVRHVTGAAILHDVRMLIQEGPLFFTMTLRAGFLDRVPP